MVICRIITMIQKSFPFWENEESLTIDYISMVEVEQNS
jgi:hypothetical protein